VNYATHEHYTMPPNVPVTRAGGGQGYGLAILRVFVGVFFLFTGIDKLGWLVDSQPLADRFAGYLRTATPANYWYLERLVPGLPVFARLVVLGELSTGLALIAGFWTRLAAGLAFLMVLNFHLATGAVFTYSFLTDGSGLPILGALLALALGRARLPWSISK